MLLPLPLGLKKRFATVPLLRDIAVRIGTRHMLAQAPLLPIEPAAEGAATPQIGERLALDLPAGQSIERVQTFSGWYLADRPLGDEERLEILLDGRPVAQLGRAYRPDVAAAFPGVGHAVRAGFLGDLIVPDDHASADRVTVALQRVSPAHRRTLIERQFSVAPPTSVVRAPRLPWLADLLRVPETGEGVRLGGDGRFVGTSGRRIETVAGAPHFMPAGTVPLVRLTERGTTHPYGGRALKIIDAADGPVLDFGAGIQSPERLRDNVVNLDVVHFPNVDVVNAHPTLPYADGVFAAVVSQAVFEHVPNPVRAAQELFRVLRPGGTVLIDTAFMQPYHGDPSHYFNMTVHGLRRIMQGFEIEEIGVQPHQYPSLGLLMQVETVMPLVANPAWRARFDAFRELLVRDGAALDAALGPVGREVLAAGVFVVARKPRS
jgi:SAM-dependent methyltransferase